MRVGNLQDGSMLSTLGDNEGIMLFAGVALNAINAIWGGGWTDSKWPAVMTTGTTVGKQFASSSRSSHNGQNQR